MTTKQIEAALLETVVERVRERLPADQADRAAAFVGQYYRWVPPEDLAGHSAVDLYGAGVAHWNLARERAPGSVKVHVYNPTCDQHGWQSTHTVLEIVSDDMPFIVDSVTMELSRLGYGIHLIIHPVVRVRREAGGELAEIFAPDADDGTAESVLHIEVDRESDAERLENLDAALRLVLGEVRAAVDDWPAMRDRLHAVVDELTDAAPVLEPDELSESRAYLRWLDDHHFTFLGYRDYDLASEGSEAVLRAVEGSGLGILRGADPRRASAGRRKLSPQALAIALEPQPLVLTKSNTRATVHRPSYLDYVGVKRFGANGEVVGERLFLGLYTTLAYRERAQEIPIVRGKVDAVLARADFPVNSHDRKALIEVLETYPREELLEISPDELFTIAMGILAIAERQRVRLFVRRDRFERFFSCLVFVPRDRYNTEARERIAAVLREAFAATRLDWSLLLSESVLVRLHYVLRVDPGRTLDFEPAAIEARLVEVTRAWTDDLRTALIDDLGEEHGMELYRRYEDACPTAYRAEWMARSAVADIRRAEEIGREGDLIGMSLYRPLEAAPGFLRCKLFSVEAPISLSDVMPIFEKLGARVVDERPYEIEPRDSRPLWIYDFGFTSERTDELDTDKVRELFQEAFIGVWRGLYENDGLNRLVLGALLSGRDVTVLRAVARYLRQAGTSFSDSYMERALTNQPDIARLFVELFHARFDPRDRDPEAAERTVAEIERAIDAVESLDEDRILRNHLSVLCAMTRTDHFQLGPDGNPKPELAFKLDPGLVPLVPEPRPRFEIFVYSPRTEGVHLRGGRVARGGLRWSDRREDFRTEILGLMKAQMVKNAVIVPVGAKGGFVVKRPPTEGGRDALIEEVIACYRTFIGALLGVTDNIVDGKVVPPPGVVRYDEDDPYLVVAADKGTATFSDIANGISRAHGFWLGDAFASGGSVGYDHKKMGITARGAWESVKRHFRELGTDVQTHDFTVVGIGDMSGDVFGNGMLLSPHIKLIGAFNHMHVFLDPDPDPATSYAERQRLFELPRSAWSDYRRELISDGGGVYSRSAKSIPLSAQVRAALEIEDEALPPNELIRALLRAPVDLLWNGGIGTYVKARSETHADAGDKATDAVRVDGAELRCRVIGEGGNLGLTQRGRIEYALAGGHVNTDAIDNAGGVNCSDREVNIKILLDSIVADGDLTTKQRNDLLAEMTDAVAELVLRDSYRQTQTLSLGVAQAPAMLDVHARLMRSLEQAGKLNREIAFLPGEEEIEERKLAGQGLTSPEVSVVLAYSKVSLYAALLDSDLPEDAFLARELAHYFPPPLPERFAEQMRSHRLRREIIATRVTNDLVDCAGSTFLFRLGEETGAPAADVARAFTVAREVFEVDRFWSDIETLDNVTDTDTQALMLLEARKLVERAARWLVRNRRPIDVAATIEHFAEGAATLAAALPGVLDGAERKTWKAMAARCERASVPAELAARAAAMGPMFAALDIVEVADATQQPVETVTAAYFSLVDRLSLQWLRDRILELPRSDRWQALARAALRDDLYNLQRALTAQVLQASPNAGGVEAAIDAWAGANAAAVERCLAMLADIRVSRTFDLTTLPVALREVRNLVQSTSAEAPVEAQQGS